MRLAYVTRVAVPSRSAAATQVHAMARAFHAVLGQEFSIISGRGDDAVPDSEHIAWRRIRVPRNRFLKHLVVSAHAVSLLQRWAPVIYTRDIVVALAVTILGGSAVYEAHKPPVGRVARMGMRWLSRCRRCRVVAISNALARHLRERFRWPKDRILVAHDGAFPEEYEVLANTPRRSLRAELGLPGDKHVVVHTGSLYKGGAELFGEIAGVDGDDIFFVHVGGSAEDCRIWQSHYENLGYRNMRFIEHQDRRRASKYQMAADVLLFVSTNSSPIHQWTSPLKIFEYMASGVPILGACSGGGGEILSPANAFCYDPDDPVSLRSAFKECLANPTEANRRAEIALQQVRCHYSWHIRARTIVSFALEGNPVAI